MRSPGPESGSLTAPVDYLRSTKAIRERCGKVFELAERGELPHLRLHLHRLGDVADFVCGVIQERHPDFRVPVHSRWRHFDVGNVPRVAELEAKLGNVSADERARAKLDLAVVSVLLDAGAGSSWKYREGSSGGTFNRSEGLAVASLRMFLDGAFSSRKDAPLRADADGLLAFSEEALKRGFQLGDDNPLEGVAGRVSLLRSLGDALKKSPALFGTETARPGNLLDALRAKGDGKQIEALDVLGAVLDGFSPIWPGRVVLEGVPLGDVWPFPPLGGGSFEQLVPFHKLSQWLTYSLFEPMEEAGLRILDINELTGLAEYRNGGLFVDAGVIEVADPADLERAHAVGSELVVAWRALTVVLLDRLAHPVREKIGRTATEFPLASMLEGGTWFAGRKLATARRPDASPPIKIISDGTVF
jgi:hypothetical protein